MKKLILGFALVAIGNALAGDIYSCVDKGGKRRIQDTPCSSKEKTTDVFKKSSQVQPELPTQAKPERSIQAKPMQVDGNGVIELRRGNGGNYYINGSIGDVPVVFQVDTGASITSIPDVVARNIGIDTCSNRLFYTANGTVNGCVAVVPELTFGNFRINNVEVAVMPDMKQSLLGMNVLSHIKMEQAEGVMRIGGK